MQWWTVRKLNSADESALTYLIDGLTNKRDCQALVGALKSGTERVRRKAAEALGSLKDRAAVQSLFQALKDSDAEVQWRAASALADCVDATHGSLVKPIIVLFQESEDLRCGLARVLGKIGDRSALPCLIAQYQGEDSSSSPIVSALEDLCIAGDVAAVPTLRKAAASHSDPWVRSSAVQALSKIGGQEAVQAIVLALRDSDEQVRAVTAKMLGAAHDAASVEALGITMHDTSERVRQNAVEALSRIDHPRAKELLRVAAQDNSASEVSASACNALREAALNRLADAETVDQFRMAVSDLDTLKLSDRLIGQLLRLSTRRPYAPLNVEALTVLKKFISDSGSELPENAGKLLMPEVAPLISSDAALVAQQAISILECIQGIGKHYYSAYEALTTSVNRLQKELCSPYESTRASAADLLCMFSDPAVVARNNDVTATLVMMATNDPQCFVVRREGDRHTPALDLGFDNRELVSYQDASGDWAMYHRPKRGGGEQRRFTDLGVCSSGNDAYQAVKTLEYLVSKAGDRIPAEHLEKLRHFPGVAYGPTETVIRDEENGDIYRYTCFYEAGVLRNRVKDELRRRY